MRKVKVISAILISFLLDISIYTLIRFLLVGKMLKQ